MLEYFKQFMSNLLSEECFEQYFLKFNYFHYGCFKTILCKIVGYVIIIGSVLVKLPQIIKIISNNSAEGLSISSTLMDTLVITLGTAYCFVKEFPFSSWGENLFVAIQTFVVSCLVLFHLQSFAETILFSIIYLMFCYILISDITPVEVLWWSQVYLTIPIISLGKLLQIWKNFTNKSTGQLSALTNFLMLLGNLLRVSTTIQETDDLMMLVTISVVSSLNFIIVLQLVYYWNSDKDTSVDVNKDQLP